jgi:hypothetical protein
MRLSLTVAGAAQDLPCKAGGQVKFRRERPEVEARSAAVLKYGEHRSFEIGARSRKFTCPGAPVSRLTR